MFVAVYKDFVLQGLIQSWICFVNGSYTEHYPVPEPEGHYYAMGFSLSQGLMNFNFQYGSIINTLINTGNNHRSFQSYLPQLAKPYQPECSEQFVFIFQPFFTLIHTQAFSLPSPLSALTH